MAQKTTLEISLLLPNLPDSQDACVKRLLDLLEAKGGVESAHVLESEMKAPGEVCIHYDPDRISISEVRELALRAGMTLQERFGHLLLRMETMHARRARMVAARAKRIAGVLEAAASSEGILHIEYDREKSDEQAILVALKSSGLKLKDSRNQTNPNEKDHVPGHGGVLGEQAELIFAIICGSLLLIGWSLSFFNDVTPWASWSFYLGAYFFGGFFTLREAAENIRGGRFEIDFLMLVAAIGAASLSEWAEGALLLTLFSLGHALEHYAMGRARLAIESLAELAPKVALVRRDKATDEVSVDQLQLGDIVIVKPNDRIPADGFVIKGESSVNQGPITGESVPVDKRPVADPRQASDNPDRLDAEHRVFAGTINNNGVLEVQVTKLSRESMIARVVEMVSEAETYKSPTQRFTERFERYFVPAVLSFVLLLLFAWIVVDEPFSASFYRAMAVLVAASPCALAISTPSAVLSGVGRAARGGVLIKGGGPLENLGRLGAIAFDKTGTLTEGKPQLTDVVSCDGVAVDELLRVVIAVEELSDHPLAAAVVRDGKSRLESTGSDARNSTSDARVLEADSLESITGRGVRARIDGQVVHIGKDKLFAEVDGAPLPDMLREQVEVLESQGRTTMIVRYGERYLGLLGLMDTPRVAARKMVARLRELGIRKVIMISGDNQQVADGVAKQVGIDESWGDLMPEDKVAEIKKLRRKQDVAMVGDGVNDAPAMANATVGIAMGAAGSDIALETADVALLADDLNQLPFAVGLSRKTSRVIRQNLWLSLGMVLLLVPATVFGLRMGPAVMFHEGSTLLVVVNALRLLVYPKPVDTEESC